MAELLMKYVTYVHPDPVLDRRGAYKRGDIVVVRPDGWSWGRKEVLAANQGGKFSIIKLPDLTVAEAEEYLQPERLDTDPKVPGPAVSRRRYFCA